MFSLTTPDGELPLEWRVSYPYPHPPRVLEWILAAVLCEVGIFTRQIPTFRHGDGNTTRGAYMGIPAAVCDVTRYQAVSYPTP
jgi:hypothetical protein